MNKYYRYWESNYIEPTTPPQPPTLIQQNKPNKKTQQTNPNNKPPVFFFFLSKFFFIFHIGVNVFLDLFYDNEWILAGVCKIIGSIIFWIR